MTTTRKVCALSLALAASAGYAADDNLFEDSLWALSPEELGQIRVTSIASGTITPLDKAAAVTTVITAEDIAAMGATDIDEVLETVPGLHVSPSTLAYFPRYYFRGIVSARNPQTLMLVNGIPLRTLVFGNRGHIWGGMPLKAVERIEVIRGPGSALYGADAFAGVINVITKSGKEINGTYTGARAGSFDTQAGWLLHGGVYGDWDIGVSLEYEGTDGFKEIIASDAQTINDNAAGTAVSHAPGSVNLGRDITEVRLEAGFKSFKARLGYQGRNNLQTGPGVIQALDPYGEFRSDRVNADLTYDFSNLADHLSASAQVSYYYGTQDPESNNYLYPKGTVLVFSPGSTASFPDGFIGNPGYKEQNVLTQISSLYSGSKDHRIRLGLGYFWGDVYETTETKNFTPMFTPRPGGLESVADTDEVWLPEKDRTSYFGYIQDEWQFAQNWQLTSGLRYDHYSDFGQTMNPRAALIWATTESFTSKLLYGRAFRAPSFEELFVISNPFSLGNPDLKPETIDTYELAFTHYLSKEVEYSMNFFYYRIKDFITFAPLNDGTPRSQAKNVGRRKGYGTELEVKVNPSDKWTLTANYAYQKSVDEAMDEDVGDAPNHQIYVRSDYWFDPQWALHTQINWVGRQQRPPGDTRPDLDDYATVDAGVRYFQGQQIEASLFVKNIFDRDAKEPGPASALPEDLPLAGRSIYASLQYKF
ncbi:TonB-dependent receptor [Hahella aquimaris]|uniref:TonB-dependent receptor plug domain-containing protein n=1 Tax=Hahella sp. HNIBRBA332 TaxID=3015983 RepID=UPI00273BBE0F|nr:TonB-dependent receptor [Hahella sp. HNIBRBA332]WLQ15601.1 TonB-dependent receptor [Hahella sp. HNIBRBA332]